MDLRHLRYFAAVYEERHMTRAAERLGLRQPPLSQQIRALETELDVRLFRRTPKGMEPTAPAHVLYNRVRSLAFQLDETIETVRSIARGEEGRLAIGVSSSQRRRYPRLIRFPLSRRWSVTLSEDSRISSRSFVPMRRTWSLRGPCPKARHPVATRPGTDVRGASSNHALREDAAEGGSCRAEGRSVHPLPAAGGPGLAAIIAACQRAGFSPAVRDEALRMPSTLNFVAAGLGVSIVPESLTRVGVEGIVYAPINDRPALTAPLNIVYRHTIEGAGRRFVTHARSGFPEVAGAHNTPSPERETIVYSI